MYLTYSSQVQQSCQGYRLVTCDWQPCSSSGSQYLWLIGTVWLKDLIKIKNRPCIFLTIAPLDAQKIVPWRHQHPLIRIHDLSLSTPRWPAGPVQACAVHATRLCRSKFTGFGMHPTGWPAKNGLFSSAKTPRMVKDIQGFGPPGWELKRSRLLTAARLSLIWRKREN